MWSRSSLLRRASLTCARTRNSAVVAGVRSAMYCRAVILSNGYSLCVAMEVKTKKRMQPHANQTEK